MTRATIAGVFGVLLGIVLLAPAAFAEGEVCKAEMQKLCAKVKPGGGRVLSCLRKHDKDLSDKCRAYVNAAMQYRACLDDAVRLCPDMEPAGGRVLECLRTHQNDLSSECQNELNVMRR